VKYRVVIESSARSDIDAAYDWIKERAPRRYQMVNEALESHMKVEYDRETDTLTGTLRDGVVAESDEDKPGVILDYNDVGNLLSIEVLDASQWVQDLRSVKIQTSAPRPCGASRPRHAARRVSFSRRASEV
jgi:uncharacterized protein YuzE